MIKDLMVIQENLLLAYEKLNEILFNKELNEKVIFTFQSSKNAYGWYAPIRWIKKLSDKNEENEKIDEISITPEFLGRGYFDIMSTLVHEMVHKSNEEKGIKDCSPNGRHLKSFKDAAEKVGFIVTKIKKSKGFHHTTPDENLTKIINELEIDKSVFNLERLPIIKISKSKPKTIYECPNGCISFKHNKKNLNLICGECNEALIAQIDE